MVSDVIVPSQSELAREVGTGMQLVTFYRPLWQNCANFGGGSCFQLSCLHHVVQKTHRGHMTFTFLSFHIKLIFEQSLQNTLHMLYMLGERDQLPMSLKYNSPWSLFPFGTGYVVCWEVGGQQEAAQ